jgi:hypothetical protein
MPERPQTTLHNHRDRAISILGLPADFPITHEDVNRAADAKLAQIQDDSGRAALELVRDLAQEYVYARGWGRHMSFRLFAPRKAKPSQPRR